MMSEDTKKIDGYKLSKQWFDWAYDHPEQNSPTHAGFIFWLIELNNRLGWKEKFGLPTIHTMEVLNIRSYKTYKNVFTDLCQWGFIKLHQKAKNNHTANIIELVIFTSSTTNSLTNSVQSQLPTQCRHNKTINNKTINNKLINNECSIDLISTDTKTLKTSSLKSAATGPNSATPDFEAFWTLYNKKKGKKAAGAKWNKLSAEVKSKIMAYLPAYIESTPNIQYRRDPVRFINNETWEDEIITSKGKKGQPAADLESMKFENPFN